MKSIILLFVYLIAKTTSQKIPLINPNALIDLSEKDSEGYFYLKAKHYTQTEQVYIYFQDFGFELDYNSFSICYTDEDPQFPQTLSSCQFINVQNYHSSNVNSPMEEYYFNFDYKSGELKQYIIAHYKGFSNGRIQVLSSDNELFKNIKERVENALYQVKIGFIIVG